MRQLMICAAAATVFASLLASVPAKADHNYGAIRNGNQCWKDALTRKGEFGYWAACAQPAAAPRAAGRRAPRRG